MSLVYINKFRSKCDFSSELETHSHQDSKCNFHSLTLIFFHVLFSFTYWLTNIVAFLDLMSEWLIFTPFIWRASEHLFFYNFYGKKEMSFQMNQTLSPYVSLAQIQSRALLSLGWTDWLEVVWSSHTTKSRAHFIQEQKTGSRKRYDNIRTGKRRLGMQTINIYSQWVLSSPL